MNTTLLWIAFAVIVCILLAVDLFVANRRAHVVRMREALTWSAVWVTVAMCFAGGVFWFKGGEAGMAFLAAYAIEEALSIDNLFVFLVLFQFFKLPRELEHTALFWGVIGALVMRGIMIVAGLALLEHFHWLIYAFGGLLIFTGLKLAFQRGMSVDPENNPVLKLLKRFVPMTPDYEGAHLAVKRDGRWIATPMVAVLVAVETSDLLFALDSIPAVMAISRDPFIVYTSNAFAILGLRSMFFALSGLMERLKYFSLGLAAVLVFVGIKMLLSEVHPIPTPVSLAVVAGLVAVAVAASLASGSASASGGGSTEG